MAANIYIYDPTAQDSLSRVRGVGRFMQILRENADKKTQFVNNLREVPTDSVFVNPFLNIIQNPLITKRIARHQVAMIHDLIPLKYPAHFPLGIRGAIAVFRNKQLLKLYDHFVTNSETSKCDIMAMLGVPAQKISVAYPCLSAQFTQIAVHPLPSSIPKNYFLYVGDVTWNKNIAMIARAIKRANATCVFVGQAFANINPVPSNPWLRELKDFATIVQDDSRYIFPGFVDTEMLKSLYKNAVANILISHDEGFGFSYVEAASQKTPSILAAIPIFHETAGKNAIFVDQTNEASVAQIMTSFMESPQLKAQIGTDAYDSMNKFSSSQFIHSWQHALNFLK